MSNLKELTEQRGHIKSRVTRFQTYFNLNKDNEAKLFELRVRLRNIVPCLDEFDKIQNQIDSVDSSEKQINYRNEFESLYFELVADVEKHLHFKDANSVVTAPNTTASVPVNSSQQNIQVKLPVISLPSFTGQYEQWISFSETFNSLIDQNKELNNIQKFHYLKSCLKGEAASTIETLTPSDGNYQIALDSLKKRFENKRLIVKTHVSALFNLPNVIKNNVSSLRSLYDKVNTNLKLLKNLKLPTEHWDSLIVHLVTSKFDHETNREWELTLKNDIPTFTQLNEYMHNRCSVLESLEQNTNTHRLFSHVQPAKIGQSKVRTTSHASILKSSCPLCKRGHFINQCTALLNMDIKTRKIEIEKLKLCTNCFRSNHTTENCFSKSSCKICKQKHHSLLHYNQDQSNNGNTSLSSEPTLVAKPSTSMSINSSCNLLAVNSQILLSTAVVHVLDSNAQYHDIRVLLDVGSQSNFISESVFQMLGLSGKNISVPISGINQSTNNVKTITTVNFKSRHNEFNQTIECLVLPTITENLPTITFNTVDLNIPRNIKLADNNFNISSPIDMLIGAELFWELLCIGQIKLGKNKPFLQKTKLGWIIGGPLPLNYKIQTLHSYTCTQPESLNTQIAKFWEIENSPIEANTIKTHSKQEGECEMHFLNTRERDACGRYVTKLPFKSNVRLLGFSKEIALKRFHSMEGKLRSQPELKQQYAEFMKEYINLGHMEKIPDEQMQTNNQSYYLPHHAVIKPAATTSKLRVVFDGSAKTTTGISLNDSLMIGPTIQETLFNILCRFRTHQIAITADIEKMYRQILIHPSERNYLRILWRENEDHPINTYQLNTVTYGTASAPYTAIRCLQDLADNEVGSFPNACNVLKQDFYVDDLISGTNNIQEAINLRNELVTVLSKGGFTLHKWASNDSRVTRKLHETQSCVKLDDSHEVKTLGLIWDYENDTFKYSINDIQRPARVTKRFILSTIARVFDPFGLIGPILIQLKIIMQRLWSLKLDWDESVPSNVCNSFEQFLTQMKHINEIVIPRKIISQFDPDALYEIHAFCDASETAYGTCIYLKTRTSNCHNVKLVCAKARVAPLKTISLPRLELCGALLASRLTQTVIQALKVHIDKCYYWTDSMIVLSWLAASPNTWTTFIANRVSEIQSNTNSGKWCHVPSKQNPADLISRGVSPRALISSEIWFSGPPWLIQHSNQWPMPTINHDNREIPERRKISLLTTTNSDISILTQFSSFRTLKRVVAYCLRFSYNCRNSSNKKINSLSKNELQDSHNFIIKLIQSNEFNQDINDLKNKKQIHKKSKLISLNPFLDDHGLLRVGGRLGNAPITYDKKHPILLPRKSHITDLIIIQEHKRLLHAGTKTTLSSVRQTYWPIAGVQTVKRVLFQCVTCFRAKPRQMHQLMGELPNKRVEPARPFLNCGVDYAGPITLKTSSGRGSKTTKAYICIFVCFSTKAVHIELASDLSTDAFLNVLKRFISRRGNVSNIYSDNATNFVGADRELKALAHMNQNTFPQTVSKELENSNIVWHFIAPRSPHLGGLWEASVKSAKTHVRKVIGSVLLNYEEMYTFLTRIEAVLNSRPLCPISSDPNDLIALTPGHFLIGEPLTAPLEPDLTQLKINRLSRWQHIEYMRQHFWKRWSRDYLTQLQHRPKWQQQPTSQLIKVGSMVLLRDENLPPMKWRLGRVTELHPGADGNVRVISVRTATGSTKRAVRQVCVLPINE